MGHILKRGGTMAKKTGIKNGRPECQGQAGNLVFKGETQRRVCRVWHGRCGHWEACVTGMGGEFTWEGFAGVQQRRPIDTETWAGAEKPHQGDEIYELWQHSGYGKRESQSRRKWNGDRACGWLESRRAGKHDALLKAWYPKHGSGVLHPSKAPSDY